MKFHSDESVCGLRELSADLPAGYPRETHSLCLRCCQLSLVRHGQHKWNELLRGPAPSRPSGATELYLRGKIGQIYMAAQMKKCRCAYPQRPAQRVRFAL